MIVWQAIITYDDGSTKKCGLFDQREDALIDAERQLGILEKDFVYLPEGQDFLQLKKLKQFDFEQSPKAEITTMFETATIILHEIDLAERSDNAIERFKQYFEFENKTDFCELLSYLEEYFKRCKK